MNICCYLMETLNYSDALRLFNLKAFGSVFVPKNDFIQLSESVVKYADGLPLALEVLGSFLCGRSASQWRSAIERLKSDLHKEIHERLQISFDGLEETEKNIFLDIACFFKGEDKDFVMKILDACDFFPNIGIYVLIKKCLLTLNEFNQLRMHDLLQEMGRKIVKQKSPDDPRRRCRLWKESDIYHVLTKNITAERVESLVVDYKSYQVPREQKWNLNVEVFLKMKKLRLLKILDLPIARNLTYLSSELLLFEWHGYAFKSLPSSFQPDNLVALILPYSGIKQLWTRSSQPLNYLKFINLKGCEQLIKTPDFRVTPNLENLVLEGCIKIKELHSSLGQLSVLVLLNLKDCRSLLSLPNILDGLKSLKTLNLSGCSKIENLPQSLQLVESLEQLDLSSTAIRKLESFIFQFKNLKFLSLEKCNGVPSELQVNLPLFFKMMRRRNPNSKALMLPPLSGLSSLIRLNLSDCNLGEGTIPNDICYLSCLRYLNLNGNNFINLPATLGRLSNLAMLQLSNCKRLKSVPDLQTRHLHIDGCTSLEAFNVTFGNSTEVAYINGANSYRLVEDNTKSEVLKRHLKVFAKKRQPLSMIIPGSEIPEWFSKDFHTNFNSYESSSIKISFPRHTRNDSQLVGVTLCIIVCPAFGEINLGNNEPVQMFPTDDYVNIQWDQFVTPTAMDHLWLNYMQPDILSGEYEIEFSFEKFLADCLLPTEMVSSFKKLIVDNILPRIKKCGIRLVYEKDLEEMKHMNDAPLKRKRDIYQCEEC